MRQLERMLVLLQREAEKDCSCHCRRVLVSSRHKHHTDSGTCSSPSPCSCSPPSLCSSSPCSSSYSSPSRGPCYFPSSCYGSSPFSFVCSACSSLSSCSCSSRSSCSCHSSRSSFRSSCLCSSPCSPEPCSSLDRTALGGNPAPVEDRYPTRTSTRLVQVAARTGSFFCSLSPVHAACASQGFGTPLALLLLLLLLRAHLAPLPLPHVWHPSSRPGTQAGHSGRQPNSWLQSTILDWTTRAEERQVSVAPHRPHLRGSVNRERGQRPAAIQSHRPCRSAERS
mmetsp:Transcript_14420/g.43334  ORF Transcript_14420/g.43334 Transcript_14420/m.43334 type:complete len:282 (+) Transcript_14420:2813-3658(+)